MPSKLAPRAQDYYDMMPSRGNSAGDIWADLPNNGLLGSALFTSGLVITPACDLANRKVESITYLPIIPARSYFVSPAFLPDLLRETNVLCENLGYPHLVEDIHRFFPPSAEVVQVLRLQVEERLLKPRISKKDTEYASRVLAGLRLIDEVRRQSLDQPPSASDLRLFLGERAWRSTVRNIITNSFRLDLHFLPHDRQQSEWSGVPEHSVVLFRYPVTAPVDVFECAQDLSLIDWAAVVSRISSVIPAAAAFDRRPTKRLTLRSKFLNDLLTRYISMYVRLGSPDFTPETVAKYSAEIGGEE